jgi:hypothetical protein
MTINPIRSARISSGLGKLKFDINLITKDQQIQNILLIANHLLMKPVFTLKMFLYSLLFVLDGSLNAQATEPAISAQEINSRKWSFSLSASGNVIGVGKQMESSLVDAGFGDVYTFTEYIFGLNFTTTKDYPIKTSSSIPWNLEVRHALSARHAVAATFGNSYHASITGYNKFGESTGHFLTLDTKVLQFSVDYIFTLTDSYTGFRIGPVMAIHRLYENGSTENQQSTTTIKPGLNLGFDVALFQKKSWFMAVSIGGSLIPSVTVGPYIKEGSYYQDNVLKHYTSTYEASKIQLSSLKIGLTMGWRL